MSKKKFNAILAKNNIAREIRDYKNCRVGCSERLNKHYIIECLKDIEDYLGESNQPCVIDIIEDKTGSI